MGFKEGNQFGKGRPQGSQNKTTKDIRDSVSLFLGKNEDRFNAAINELNDKEFCQLYLKMIKMILPPVRSLYYSALEDD